MPNTAPDLLFVFTTRFAVITVARVVDAVGACCEVVLASWGGLVRVAVRLRDVDDAVRLANKARNARRFPAAAALLAFAGGAQ